MSDVEDRPGDHWTTDKRIPIALIVALLIQTGGAVWWAATISKTVSDNSKAIAELATAAKQLGNEFDSRLKLDREFHVEQRVRLWNRTNEMQALIQDTRATMEGLRVSIDSLNRATDRMMTLMLEDRRSNKGVTER